MAYNSRNQLNFAALCFNSQTILNILSKLLLNTKVLNTEWSLEELLKNAVLPVAAQNITCVIAAFPLTWMGEGTAR